MNRKRYLQNTCVQEVVDYWYADMQDVEERVEEQQDKEQQDAEQQGNEQLERVTEHYF